MLLQSVTNSSVTDVDVRLEAWEDDDISNAPGSADRCSYDSGDDCYENNHFAPIIVRNDPQCTWKQYDYLIGDFGVAVRIRWEYSDFDAGPATMAGCDSSVVLQGQGSGEWSIVSGTGGGFSNIQDPTATFTGNAGTTYDLQWNSLAGCATTLTDNITIDLNPSPNPDLQVISTLICENGDVDFSAANGATYYWSTGNIGNIVDSSSSNFTVNNVSLGDIPVYVQVVDGNGCTNSDSVSFTLTASPIANFGLDTTICENTTVTLDATDLSSILTSYLWNTTETSSIISVGQAGQYICTLTNLDNCTASDTINVSLFASQQVALGIDQEMCIGDTITLDAGAGYTDYNWYNSDVSQTTEVIAFDTAWVLVTDTNGCITGDSVVFSPTYTSFALYADTTIFLGTSIDLVAPVGSSYIWSTGDTSGTISITPTESTTYTVTISQANGCFDVGTVYVIIDEEANLFIPTMFSPNDDYANDLFLVYGSGIQEIYFKVYNKWGEIVYETEDLIEIQNTGWDGKFNGEPQPVGSYFWTMTGTTIDGNALQFQGKNRGTVLLRR